MTSVTTKRFTVAKNSKSSFKRYFQKLSYFFVVDNIITVRWCTSKLFNYSSDTLSLRIDRFQSIINRLRALKKNQLKELCFSLIFKSRANLPQNSLKNRFNDIKICN